MGVPRINMDDTISYQKILGTLKRDRSDTTIPNQFFTRGDAGDP